MSTIKYLNDDGVKYIFSKIKAAKTEALAAVANLRSASIVVAQSLPTPASADYANYIYLIPHSGHDNASGGDDSAASDSYDEYVCVDNGSAYVWEKIGNTDINLSGFLKTTTPSVSGSGDAVTGISISNQTIQVTKGSVGRKVVKGAVEVPKGTDITLTDQTTNQGDVSWTLTSGGVLKAQAKVDGLMPQSGGEFNGDVSFTHDNNGASEKVIFELDDTSTPDTIEMYGEVEGIVFEHKSGGSSAGYVTIDCKSGYYGITYYINGAYQTLAFPATGGTISTNQDTHAAYTSNELDALWTAAS